MTRFGFSETGALVNQTPGYYIERTYVPFRSVKPSDHQVKRFVAPLPFIPTRSLDFKPAMMYNQPTLPIMEGTIFRHPGNITQFGQAKGSGAGSILNVAPPGFDTTGLLLGAAGMVVLFMLFKASTKTYHAAGRRLVRGRLAGARAQEERAAARRKSLEGALRRHGG